MNQTTTNHPFKHHREHHGKHHCNRHYLGGGILLAILAVSVAALPSLSATKKQALQRDQATRAKHRHTTIATPPLSALAATPRTSKQTVVNIPAFPQCVTVGHIGPASEAGSIRPCQAFGPIEPYERCGLDCGGCQQCQPSWRQRGPIPWQVFAQGEYVGPHRTRHVSEYRLRVDDVIDFVYRLTREKTDSPYQLNVGDSVQIESITDAQLNRDLIIQPDGNITLLMLGQVRAAGLTVAQVTQNLEQAYKKFYPEPAITVTPLLVNTKLDDLRNSVDSRYGTGGQARQSRVTPEGTIQLPAIGSVPAQGLTLAELKREVDQRYMDDGILGIEVTPILFARAPRYVYVLGEVRTPGRFELTGPTTVMQSIAMAGGWNYGGALKYIVVFRRAEDWRLIATRLDLRSTLFGNQPCPADEIWIRDSDLVLIPKNTILRADDFIDLVFTRGIYGVLPMSGIVLNFSKLSSI